jgi:hypothetical protein
MNHLNEAAKIIEQGWTKGEYADELGNVCAVGALRKALNNPQHQSIDSSDWTTYRESITIMSQVTGEMTNGLTDNPVQFNDMESTTKQDIVALFEKSAVRWDERI